MVRIHVIISLAAASGLLGAASQPVVFNKDIRPILADACFHCHGPDPGTRKAGLRLDTEAGFFTAKKGEQPTVIKGKPDASSLYQRLLSKDEDEVMPPPDSHKELKPGEIAKIKDWIEQGAPWQPHWSLIPPQRPAVPAVKDESWVKTPIDRFVLARLEQAGLKPAPEADAYTLVRRLSLDLTGLPPAPELLKKYATSDRLTDAQVSALMDELMKSPAYGEHRARYWLDAARYGDTHGLHFDNYREMWPYRDWVVKAFNANQPFDQFTVEQIAGDLLPNRTDDQLIATGFQRCNITTNEGGTIDEENLANYAVDRVQTLGWVYFGLTTNCAQCHDHKFDPFTMKDFYSMAAFFRNTTQPAKDGNVKDGRGPTLVIPADQDKPRWKALQKEIASASARRNSRKVEARAEFTRWLTTAKPDDALKGLPAVGLVAHLPLTEGKGAPSLWTDAGGKSLRLAEAAAWQPGGKLGAAAVVDQQALEMEGVGGFEKNQAFSFGAWIRPAKGSSGNIMGCMDEDVAKKGWNVTLEGKSLAVNLVSRWPEEAVKVITRSPVIKPEQWQHVLVTYDGGGKGEGVKIFANGKLQPSRITVSTLSPTSTIRSTSPVRVGGQGVVPGFLAGAFQDVRVYNRAITPGEVEKIAQIDTIRKLLATPPEKRKPQDEQVLFETYLGAFDAKYIALNKSVTELESSRDLIKARSPITHVQEEVMKVAPMANILVRGAYDKPGERVGAAVPAAFGRLPEKAPKNRLGLAQWIVSKENPLTARVTVNRFWQEVFGQGLVKTPEDFGIMGAAPSHPELLEWLAVEFRDGGWDVKKLFKLMLTSATYRQMAATTPEKLEKDRDNSLLSRGPRFRMDAEMLRDYALAASGLLSARMGGPSVKPYQPEGIWDVVGLPGGDTRNYVQDKGENLYRRTFYTFWKRMAPPPNMEVFNAPSREVCTVRRERTNTPLQALVTMNDPQFVEAARKLAEKAIACGCNDDTKALAYVAERIFCRPLKDKEKPIIEASLKDLRAHYTKTPSDAEALLKVGESPVDAKLPKPELAAWTMLTNQLFNLDEVLNK